MAIMKIMNNINQSKSKRNNENVINNGIMAKAKNNMASNRGYLLASACGWLSSVWVSAGVKS
jgi:hypothetical protein